MINIIKKTEQEINEEQNLYKMGANIADGIVKKVCPTYLIKNDGTKVNTYDLNEEQILGLIQNDLIDYTSTQGTYKTTGRTDLDAIKLAENLKGHYTPSINATLRLTQLEQKFGHIVKDVMGSFGALEHFNKARIIAKFQKDCANDFTQVQQEEIVEVLEQMAINEEKKRTYSHIKF